MKKIEIEIPDGKKVEWVNGAPVLVDDITDIIKTPADAVKALGLTHPLVHRLLNYINSSEDDVSTYLKLRIICTALNNGWEPKFTEAEIRYYPCISLYTEDEIENMPKKNNLITTEGYDTEYAYLGPNVLSNKSAGVSSILCLKSRELAEYCNKQFIHLWAAYFLKRK